MTRERMISLMVGRDLDTLYPKQDVSPGKEVLRGGLSEANIAFSQNADWLRERAVPAAGAAFQTNPDLDVLYGHNDPMAEGAVIDWAHRILTQHVAPPQWVILPFDTVSPDNAQDVCNTFACPAAQ